MKSSGDLFKPAIKILAPFVLMMCILSGSCAPRYGCYYSETDVQPIGTIQEAGVCVASEVCVDSSPADH